MRLLGSTRTGFVFSWILASFWLPLLIVVWSSSIALELRPPFLSEPTLDIRILKMLSRIGLIIVCLSQSLLLVGRVRRPWVWILAGIAAFVIESVLRYALFELMLVLPKGYKDALYFVLPVIAAGLGLSIAQACAMRYWRLSGMSWFVFSFAAYWFGFLTLLAVDRIFLAFALSPSTMGEEVTRSFAKALAFWLPFAGTTGLILWHRLRGNGGEAVVVT